MPTQSPAKRLRAFLRRGVIASDLSGDEALVSVAAVSETVGDHLLGRVPHVVEKGKGVFSRHPKNNWLIG
jgi:hypothetical protein